jgi:hypothetical protein
LTPAFGPAWIRPWRDIHKTIAEGAAIKHPMRLREIIGAVRESGGDTIALTEGEIVAALRIRTTGAVR